MREPRKVSDRFRGFWSSLRRLPNRTVWVHGDSIQMQLFSAALCSLLRAGKLRTPVYARRPKWVEQLSRRPSGSSPRGSSSLSLTLRTPGEPLDPLGPASTYSVTLRVRPDPNPNPNPSCS